MKCLVLFSGGLDSRLACKIMQEQSQIIAIHFILPFVNQNPSSIEFLKQQKIRFKLVDCTKGRLLKEYLDLLRHPKHGRGTSMNHCIDCHIWILKKAKQYADKHNINLIVTGEVLGERPMSQHSKALKIIEEESGLQGRLIRPLSAKLLDETEAEKQGKIDRSRLFDIQGKSRIKQLELAGKYNINYPTPAGGCLLCEPALKQRIKELLKMKKIAFQDIQLIKIGRHIDNIILGRNQQENLSLEKMKGIKIIPNMPGPTALIQDKKHLNKAKELIQRNSKHKILKFDVKD